MKILEPQIIMWCMNGCRKKIFNSKTKHVYGFMRNYYIQTNFIFRNEEGIIKKIRTVVSINVSMWFNVVPCYKILHCWFDCSFDINHVSAKRISWNLESSFHLLLYKAILNRDITIYKRMAILPCISYMYLLIFCKNTVYVYSYF